MSSSIALMKSHRSIRQFTGQPIKDEDLTEILLAARGASSSSFIQCTSVVRVSCVEKRESLAACAGNQNYVKTCAEFLVFCADFNRHQQIVGQPIKLGYTEQLLIAAIDTGLMGQNALLAAQSLELGGVFIGGIRNNPDKVAELLNLPEHVIPLFGLCLGYPDQSPDSKPRLPLSLLVHEDSYQAMDEQTLAQYDSEVRDYYVKRSQGKLDQSWSEQIEKSLSKESRPFMLDFLQSKGFGSR